MVARIQQEIAVNQFVNYNISQYMFCHPNHVVSRNGERKHLKWQHLMAVSNLILTIRGTQENGVYSFLQLSQGSHVLELLYPLQQFVAQSLLLTIMENWVLIQWDTPKGPTYFQVKLPSQREANHFVSMMDLSGIPILHKQPSRRTGSIFTRLDSRKRSETDTQATQLPNEGDNIPYMQPHSASPDFPLIHLSEQASSFLGPTQVECLPSKFLDNEPSEFSLQLLNSLNVRRPGFSAISTDELSESRPYGYQSLCEEGSVTSLNAKTQPAELQKINIKDAIKMKQPLHLFIETYSYASVESVWNSQPLKWNHLGLTSDICMSLIPEFKTKEPVVILSRGFSCLEIIVLHPKYLHAYLTNNMLVLRQIGIGQQRPERYIQLCMKPTNLADACEWLSFWNVQAEDPFDNTPHTEATTMGTAFGLSRPASRTSYTSRESRFWERRSQKKN